VQLPAVQASFSSFSVFEVVSGVFEVVSGVLEPPSVVLFSVVVFSLVVLLSPQPAPNASPKINDTMINIPAFFNVCMTFFLSL
tara:strand:+ start:1798 stop:2046 length:249 start_codon:yes stop_codon:yes gene_type:complete